MYLIVRVFDNTKPKNSPPYKWVPVQRVYPSLACALSDMVAADPGDHKRYIVRERLHSVEQWPGEEPPPKPGEIVYDLTTQH